MRPPIVSSALIRGPLSAAHLYSSVTGTTSVGSTGAAVAVLGLTVLGATVLGSTVLGSTVLGLSVVSTAVGCSVSSPAIRLGCGVAA
jgi:hypothetical protein